jgi:hypothetical protein
MSLYFQHARPMAANWPCHPKRSRCPTAAVAEAAAERVGGGRDLQAGRRYSRCRAFESLSAGRHAPVFAGHLAAFAVPRRLDLRGSFPRAG